MREGMAYSFPEILCKLQKQKYIYTVAIAYTICLTNLYHPFHIFILQN